MKNIKLSLLPFAVFAAMFFYSCEKDDPKIPNEEELITTLKYTLTPAGGGAPIVMTFQDLDGEGGGNAPVITGGTLSSNTTYTGSMELLNELENPVENITEEVEAEDEEHQFFFSVGAGLNLTISYDDADGDGNPVGITTTVVTGDVSSGILTITLRHEPDKFAAGVDTGDISNAGGETDIEVQFNVTVQ